MNKNRALRAARAGSLYDVEAPVVQQWLSGRGFDVDALDDIAISEPRTAETVAAELSAKQAGVSLDALSGMTLAQITEDIGTPHETLVWVKVRKELAAAKRQEHLQSRMRRLLVPVQALSWCYEHLDLLTKRLVSDAVPTFVKRLMALGRSGGTTEQGIALARDAILTQVSVAKNSMQLVVAGIDTVSALKEPSQRNREDQSSAAARRALKALEKPLRDEAAAEVVDMVTKWNALPSRTAEETVSGVGDILNRYIIRAVRESMAETAHNRTAIEGRKSETIDE